MVSQVTTGDHSERANGGQGARFGAPQRVLAIAVTNELALRSARQVYVPREGVTRLVIALSSVAVALSPAGVVIAVSPPPIRPVPFVPGTAAQRPCIVAIAVASSRSVPCPVVITIAVARAAAASAVRRVGVALVVA
jgi:hypothetical protein